MDFNPITPILSILGALIVAALVGWIKRARLVVLVPKTFSYSELTVRGKGQLVEIAVFNRGWKTEDSIDVTFNPVMSYQMLGANSQDVTVDQNKLKIVRIAPSDEITALIIVENGNFKADDITQIVSKESKGATVSKAEEVGLTGPQRVQAVFWFIAIPLLLIAMFIGFQKAIEPSSGNVTAAETERKEKRLPAKIGQWTVDGIYVRKENLIYQDLLDEKLIVEVNVPLTKSDYVVVPARFTNNSAKLLVAMLSMNTNASAGKIPSYDLRVSDIVVPPGQSVERSIRVAIPIRNSDTASRSVFVEVFFKSMDGETLMMKQIALKPI